MPGQSSCSANRHVQAAFSHVRYDSIRCTTAMMAAVIQIAATPVSIALMLRSRRWFIRIRRITLDRLGVLPSSPPETRAADWRSRCGSSVRGDWPACMPKGHREIACGLGPSCVEDRGADARASVRGTCRPLRSGHHNAPLHQHALVLSWTGLGYVDRCHQCGVRHLILGRSKS